MLFAGLLALIGVSLLLVWQIQGRKSLVLRNTGLGTSVIGVLLLVIGLVFYFATA
jgi:hypothetical protein